MKWKGSSYRGALKGIWITDRVQVSSKCLKLPRWCRTHCLNLMVPDIACSHGRFEEYELSNIFHSLKSFSADEANKLLQRDGQFWIEDYFDRYIRNEEHFEKTVKYIENNPVKSGLFKNPEELAPIVMPGSRIRSRLTAREIVRAARSLRAGRPLSQ
jgi:hypothetical protein